MRILYSFILFLFIHIVRFTDHLHRMIWGLPQLARSRITPQLYLGGQYTKRGVRLLKDLGITGIISMRESIPEAITDSHQFSILHLPTPDLHAPTVENVQKGIQFIQKHLDNDGKVYIHCRLGEGRGPSMMIAYLMSTGLTFEDAYRLVKEVRPFVRLTLPQQRVLQKLELNK